MIKKKMTIKPYFQGELGAVHNQDAIQFLHSLRGIVDLQVHDIPYEVSQKKAIERYAKNGGRRDLQRNYGEWDKMPNLEDLAEGCHLAAKKDANVCIFFNNWDEISNLSAALRHWFDQVHMLTWIKNNPAPQVRKRHFLAGTEMILWASRGAYPMNFISQKEMLSWFPSGLCQGLERIKGEYGKTLHRSQKPRKVINWLVERLSIPGQTVSDAYAGVLTTAHSAVELNRRYIVNDLDTTFLDAGIERIKNMEAANGA